MKILIVNRAFGTLFGGGESFDRNAARYLATLGHDVTIVTGLPPFQKPRPTDADLDVIYLTIPNVRKYAYLSERINVTISAAFYHLDNLIFERRVMRWLAEGQRYRNFDIIQCCSLFNLPRWVLDRWQKPIVSWLPGPPSGLARQSINRLIHRPHYALFAHGTPVAVLRDQMGLVEGQDFLAIDPGLELEMIDAIKVARDEKRHELNLPPDSFVGITVARLVHIKNISFILRSLVMSLENGIPLHWLIVGDGPLRYELEQEAKSLGIEAHVHFLGFRSSQQVYELLKIADLFALTSHYENFSIAALEAMAHHLPFIGTDVGYLGTLAKNGGGIPIPPGDYKAFADALERLYHSPALRTELAQKGRAFIEQYDWPVIARQLESLYRKTIETSVETPVLTASMPKEAR